MESLWQDGVPALDPDDVVHQYVRMSRGALYFTVGRHAEAIALLEPVVADMRRDGRRARALEGETYLGQCFLATGRTGDALALLRAVLARTVALRGAASAPALEVLVPLTQAMAASGEADAALALLDDTLTPLLAPGAASIAPDLLAPVVARWIDLLVDRGDLERARGLLRSARPQDRHAASDRHWDAPAFVARCRAAGLLGDAAATTSAAGAQGADEAGGDGAAGGGT